MTLAFITLTATVVVDIVIPLATIIYIIAFTLLFLARNNKQLAREIEHERQMPVGWQLPSSPPESARVERQQTISGEVQRTAPRPGQPRTLNAPPLPPTPKRNATPAPRYEEPPEHGLPA